MITNLRVLSLAYNASHVFRLTFNGLWNGVAGVSILGNAGAGVTGDGGGVGGAWRGGSSGGGCSSGNGISVISMEMMMEMMVMLG